jgi:hypothetical protein
MYTANVEIIKSSYDDNRPTTYDYLRPNAFRFVVKDLPHTSYTCQSANLPAIQLGFAQQPTPFVDLPVIGDKINFGEFVIRFIISEDMSNYLELYYWLFALGFPKNYSQYPDFVAKRQNRFPFFVTKTDPLGRVNSKNTDRLAYSDATLTILDSTNNPKTNIIFYDIFPTSVEALDFDLTSSVVPYFVGIASFKYKLFEIETL